RFRQKKIVFKRILDRNRLRRAIGNHFIVVESPRQLVQTPAVTTELLLECEHIPRTQFCYMADSQLGEFLCGDFPYAWQAFDGQREQKCVYIRGTNNEQSIRFAPIRSKLG